MNIKSEFLTESKSLRESVIDRVDVLDKVKKLIMLPGNVFVTIDMVAAYYEVERKAVEKTIARNRVELNVDGVQVLKGKALSDILSETENSKLPPTLTVIPRRAILRIGMLLQESEVAKAVRTHLLDVEEEKQPAPVPQEYSTLSPLLQTLIGMEQRQNRLEADNAQNKAELVRVTERSEQIESTVAEIQETLLQRDNDWRKSINSMLNAAAFRIGGKYADLRRESYKRLEERAHCNLNSRLTRLHTRLRDNGATSSKIENTTRMDVIEANVQLKEIYSSIVKELSIGSLTLIGR